MQDFLQSALRSENVCATGSYKKDILSMYEINDESVQTAIIKRRKYWFTKWTDFDLAKELDAKKSQEVY